MKFSAATAFTTSAMFLALAACGGSEPATDDNPGGNPEDAADTPAPEATPNPEAEAVPASAPIATPDPVAEFASLPAPYNTADFNRGKRTWKLCQSCHLTAEGAGHLVGPNLHGLFGRQAGTMEGFAYSDALQEADFTWTPEQLDHWLENPNSFLPGNRMTFSGVRRPEDRVAVIAYLMTQTGYSAPEGEGE